MRATQKNRPITVHTPLGEDVLLFHSLTGRERLGRPFRYKAEFLSEYDSLDFDAILGHNITFTLPLAHGQTRYFNGHVSRFVQCGSLGEYHCYRAHATKGVDR